MLAIENKYLRPLPTIVIGAVIAIVLMWVGGLIAEAREGGALDFGAAFGEEPWAVGVILGAVLIYLLYVWQVDQPIWKVGTREVVYMAVGAALYGLTSWAFNAVPVPSVSLVSLRPTIVIPIFFGFAFGPVVGFFTGFMGNVLGDALTGWGVFPAWDVGNGLVGMVPGLIMALKSRERSVNLLLWVGVALLAIAALLTLVNPEITDPFSGDQADYGEWWWVPAVGIALLLVAYFVPRLWPLLMGLLVLGFLVRGIVTLVDEGWSSGVLILFIVAIIGAGLAYLLYSRRETIEEALSDQDTRTLVVWGTVGVIVGIGFAAMADIWINGYNFFTAFIGEFVPAAAPNILFAILLAPLLYGAWKQAQAQSGR